MSFRLVLFALFHGVLGALALASPIEVVVSVPEQRLYVFNDTGEKIRSYRISTASRFGDQRGTYATPLGKLEIANKIGEGAIIGTVFKGGRRTGEVVPVNAKGRDPIVTRILHLRGTEAQNARAYSRCIYIHGTPDEKHLGKPVSYGCIRMASSDVVELFNMVGIGTTVEVTQERVTSAFGAIARRPVRLQSIASGPIQAPVTAAVSTRTETAPASLSPLAPQSGAMFVTMPRATESSKRVSETRATTGSMKLLETSGLTINLGGASFDSSDRPR